MGGFPAAGPLFGAAYNPASVMPTSTMIDLIQGGNLDAAVLGCAEACFLNKALMQLLISSYHTLTLSKSVAHSSPVGFRKKVGN